MMFKVVEGIHKNPNDKNSIIKDSMKEYGPFKNKDEEIKGGEKLDKLDKLNINE